VGVAIDEAGHDDPASHVDAAAGRVGGGIARAEARDSAVDDLDPASLDDAEIRQMGSATRSRRRVVRIDGHQSAVEDEKWSLHLREAYRCMVCATIRQAGGRRGRLRT